MLIKSQGQPVKITTLCLPVIHPCLTLVSAADLTSPQPHSSVLKERFQERICDLRFAKKQRMCRGGEGRGGGAGGGAGGVCQESERED